MSATVFVALPRAGMPESVAAQRAVECSRLVSLAVPGGTLTRAEVVAAGAFKAPGGGEGPASSVYRSLPAFCRAELTLRPSSDSDIKVEVWLPVTGWNGRLQAVGNGGFSGSIGYAALARAVARGYAATSTDTGHQGPRADFAVGHPEKLTDFAYRAVHEMAVVSKQVVRSHYGTAPRYSYWNGCSSGGRQGLKEAQKFPADFDGIIAGAPANNWVHQKAANMRIQQIVNANAQSQIPPAKYPAIHKAVLEACDARDGVTDGVLEDPRACSFDPAALTCKAGDSASCLTPSQVESARAIYAPVQNPRTGAEIFPGIPRGTELSWDVPAGPEPRETQWDLWAFVVFENPKWDYRTLDLDRDVARANATDQTAAVDPNLRPFFSRGGKLLMYHGFADPNISALNTINYYDQVTRTLGGPAAVRDSMRLFMVPGMGHCSGGAGTDTFDMVTALERWVEQGQPPSRIEASRVRNGAQDRTRPLCAYPAVARYKGTGDINASENFDCAVR